MKKEHIFERKRTFQIIMIIILLFLEALIFQKLFEYYKNSDFVNLALLQLLIFAIVIPIFWKLEINNAVKFYDDGISYVDILTRKFLSWDKIERIQILEYAQGDLLELQAENHKVKIHTAIFKYRTKVMKFLSLKLKKFQTTLD